MISVQVFVWKSDDAMAQDDVIWVTLFVGT